MKKLTHVFSLLMIACLAFTGTPAFANVAASTPNADAQTILQQLSQVSAENSGAVVKKKSEKRGFFSKLKKFGQKTKLFFKTAAAMFASSDHNAAVAIILAFFLGGLGIHRVYLGGRPILILLYIITLGGIFGILPLIDFIRLIIGHMDHYENNDAFFAAFS